MTLYAGYASGSATVKVIQDVTGDNWTAGDAAVLCDVAPANYDQQRVTVDTINAATHVLSAVVDSAQYPLALLVLSARNARILSAGTSSSQAIVLYDSGDTHGGTFGELRNTAGSGTTFYGYGIYYGVGCTATTITGCSQGIRDGSGHTATTITGCSYGINSGSGHTGTTITGCSYGIYLGSGHTATTITGCSQGINLGSHVLRATIFSGNTYDLRLVGPLIGYGWSLRSGTQNYEYLDNGKDDVAQVIYDPVDGDDVLQAGRILAWTCGGY
jgi:hypothetical protein